MTPPRVRGPLPDDPRGKVIIIRPGTPQPAAPTGRLSRRQAPSPGPAPGPDPEPQPDGSPAGPVFVLCAGRSGSTLLRFLLDAHPDLACPPETGLSDLCGQMAAAWSVIAGTPLPGDDAGQAAGVRGETVAAIRRANAQIIEPYLARRGKKRYCDKSLGSARNAALLRRIYPEVRFICLYRHPMDVIASGLEACPWGLNTYGFEHYIGGSPQNMVLAMAKYWNDHATAILAAEEKFPQHCHRIRYEDLVADPEGAAERMFGFLGVPPVPGISAKCFTQGRQRFGRSDYKIWNTTQITTGSVGRGWAVPPGMIGEPVRATLNELAGKLGYRPVDDRWGTGSRPADLRIPAAGQAQIRPPAPGVMVDGLMRERIRTGLARLGEAFTRRWAPHAGESFLLAATTPAGGGTWWRVDLTARIATTGSSGTPAGPADWTIAGTAEGWEKAINNEVNLGVLFRTGQLRYGDNGGAGAGSLAADTRAAMMSELLAITAWPDDGPGPQHGQRAEPDEKPGWQIAGRR